MGIRTIKEYSGKSARLQHYLLTTLGGVLPKKRGMRKVTLLISYFFSEKNWVLISHEREFYFRIYLDDQYWTPMLFSDYHYEPEIEKIVRNAKGLADIFIDCGANIGYWTQYAATLFSKVIAIEASRSTYKKLKENAVGKNITLINAAVDSESGRKVTIIKNRVRHGAAYVSELNPGWKGDSHKYDLEEYAPTITLDSMVPSGKNAIIKIDVEGAEIQAIKGASRLISEGALIIYEDHARDERSVTTSFVLSQGLRVFSLESNYSEIRSVDDLIEIKSTKSKGYNFIAYSPGSMLSQIVRGTWEVD